jgi:2-aminoadipate transaminase
MTDLRIGRRARPIRSGPIDDILAAVAHRPEVVSFAAGLPDPALLPHEQVSALSHAVMAKYGSSVLSYGPLQGFGPLIDKGRMLLNRRNIRCPPETVLIATGGTGALHAVSSVLLDPDALVLVESPTYDPGVTAFRNHGATVVEVESDQCGILPDALDHALTRYDVSFIYLLPTFQNPTGRTMTTQRRTHVAEIILRHGALVVEDDVYADLRFCGEALPPISSLLPDQAVYITSLSKALGPAMRIGIASMPTELLERVLVVKQGIDLRTSMFCQAIAAEFLGSEDEAVHLKRATSAYSAKLKTMTHALEAHFPDDFRWTMPEGGMFLWVEGPADFDADAVLDRAMERGVAFLPGSVFFVDSSAIHRNSMRLCFAYESHDNIEHGIKLLAALCTTTR